MTDLVKIHKVMYCNILKCTEIIFPLDSCLSSPTAAASPSSLRTFSGEVSGLSALEASVSSPAAAANSAAATLASKGGLLSVLPLLPLFVSSRWK